MKLRRISEVEVLGFNNCPVYNLDYVECSIGELQSRIFETAPPTKVPSIKVPIYTEINDPFRNTNDAEKVAVVRLVKDLRCLLKRIVDACNGLLDHGIAFREAFDEVSTCRAQMELTPIATTEWRIEGITRFKIDTAGLQEGEVDVTRPETGDSAAIIWIAVNCIAELVVSGGRSTQAAAIAAPVRLPTASSISMS